MYNMHMCVVFLLLFQPVISTVNSGLNKVGDAKPQDPFKETKSNAELTTASSEESTADDTEKDTNSPPVLPADGSKKEGIPNSSAPTTPSLPPIPEALQSYRDTKTSRIGKYVVVDKTSFLKELLDNPDINVVEKIYLLARPKTFGKSFFLSMVYEFLRGSEELFKNTAILERGNTIEGTNGKWEKNCVIHINFESIRLDTVQTFQNSLKKRINQIAKNYSISMNTPDYDGSIVWLIEELNSKYGSRVSILIDGFDFPLTQSLENIRNDIIAQLKLFYQSIKVAALNSESLWLVLILGISRLQILHEAMNGLVNDITFEEKFSSIMGFSKDEVKTNFKAHIEILAEKHGRDIDTIVQNITDEYGGYRFSTNTSNTLMDPGSVCSCMKKLNIYDIGPKVTTQDDIVERMTNEQKGISHFKYYCIREVELHQKYIAKNNMQIPLHILMLNEGYLTIRIYHKKSRKVYLRYPNKGVEDRIARSLPASIRNKPHDELRHDPLRKLFQDSLDEPDMDDFVDLVNAESFPAISSSLQSSVADKKEKFGATHKIFQTLNTLKFTCEEGTLLKKEVTDAGDLDLLIFAQKKGESHFVFEVKFGLDEKLIEAIFQLFKYVVTLNLDFKRQFDNKPKANVINLVGILVKDHKDRFGTITDWILVPYENNKIRIDRVSSSDQNRWLQSLCNNVKTQKSFDFEKHKNYFILPQPPSTVKPVNTEH